MRRQRLRHSSLVVATAADMRRVGRALGTLLREGDVVGLLGPLGSGKTTLAQGIAAGLRVPADRHVASPTFALVNEHPGRVPFVHADLYRVASAAELRELGLDDAFPRAACVIEWLDRYAEVAPADRLEVAIAFADAGARHLELRGTGKRGRALAAALLLKS